MAGQATGGQTLTPNRNVFAPAGNRGNAVWGANGGDQNAIAGAGWAPREAEILSTGQGQANYQITDARSLASEASRGAISLTIADSALPTGGSNLG